MATRQKYVWQPALVDPVPFHTLEWRYSEMTWTDDRLEFIGREYTAGTPLEIIDQCLSDDDHRQDFTLTDLEDLIAARGWVRPPGWDEKLAYDDFMESMRTPRNQGYGPFGVMF
jgi:hypothetical protein